MLSLSRHLVQPLIFYIYIYIHIYLYIYTVYIYINGTFGYMYMRTWYMGTNINLSFQLEPQNEEGFFIRSEVIFLKIPISTPSVFQLEYYVNYCILWTAETNTCIKQKILLLLNCLCIRCYLVLLNLLSFNSMTAQGGMSTLLDYMLEILYP